VQGSLCRECALRATCEVKRIMKEQGISAVITQCSMFEVILSDVQKEEVLKRFIHTDAADFYMASQTQRHVKNRDDQDMVVRWSISPTHERAYNVSLFYKGAPIVWHSFAYYKGGYAPRPTAKTYSQDTLPPEAFRLAQILNLHKKGYSYRRLKEAVLEVGFRLPDIA
jgi:hypothetical protein